MTDDPLLEVWTVYKDPSDYPGQYVLRRFVVRVGEVIPDEHPKRVGNLDEVRAGIPSGLLRTAPDEADDPKILEVWL